MFPLEGTNSKHKQSQLIATFKAFFCCFFTLTATTEKFNSNYDALLLGISGYHSIHHFFLFHFSVSSDCMCLLSSVCIYVSALWERDYFFLFFSVFLLTKSPATELPPCHSTITAVKHFQGPRIGKNERWGKLSSILFF